MHLTRALLARRVFFGGINSDLGQFVGLLLHPTVTTKNPFTAPKRLPILNPSNVFPQNGFPVAQGLMLMAVNSSHSRNPGNRLYFVPFRLRSST